MSEGAVEIRGEGGLGAISLRELEREDHADSIRLEVAARFGDERFGEFAGCATVWVLRDALEAFVRALEDLERSRRGEARLEAMSPGELVLAVRCESARLGPVVSLSLARLRIGRDRHLAQGIHGEIELDPGTLPTLVGELRRLAG